jgi:regulator of RNase E activity RraA
LATISRGSPSRVTPNSAFPSGPGEVGLPLALGEVTVEAGDLVMGDRDGVVIVPRAKIGRIAERLATVAALEAEMHAKVGAGEIRSLLERMPGLHDQITYVAYRAAMRPASAAGWGW